MRHHTYHVTFSTGHTEEVSACCLHHALILALAEQIRGGRGGAITAAAVVTDAGFAPATVPESIELHA